MTPSSGAVCKRLDQIGDLCDSPVSGRVFLHFRYIRVACVIYLKNLVGYIRCRAVVLIEDGRKALLFKGLGILDLVAPAC